MNGDGGGGGVVSRLGQCAIRAADAPRAPAIAMCETRVDPDLPKKRTRELRSIRAEYVGWCVAKVRIQCAVSVCKKLRDTCVLPRPPRDSVDYAAPAIHLCSKWSRFQR